MKLIDLDPHWVGTASLDGYYIAGEPDANGAFTQHWQSRVHNSGVGITFLCPIHKNHRLGVAFANPIDGSAPREGVNLWQRTGTLFEELSLTPSIDASEHGCWHGFITNGEVR